MLLKQWENEVDWFEPCSTPHSTLSEAAAGGETRELPAKRELPSPAECVSNIYWRAPLYSAPTTRSTSAKSVIPAMILRTASSRIVICPCSRAHRLISYSEGDFKISS